VRGYKEEGTKTTPFDMVVRNDLDRFHLVADVIDRVPALGPRAAYAQTGTHQRSASGVCAKDSISSRVRPSSLEEPLFRS